MPKASKQEELEAILKLMGAANSTIGAPGGRSYSASSHTKASWIKSVEDLIPTITFVVLLGVLVFILWIVYLLVRKHLLSDDEDAVEQRSRKLIKRPAQCLVAGPNESELECHHCKAINTFPTQLCLPVIGNLTGQIADSHLGGSKLVPRRAQELEWEIIQRHPIAAPQIRAIKDQPSSSSHKEQALSDQNR